MLTYTNIVGNQEDWANFVTNVEAEQAPFMNWLPTGDKPVNTVYKYQAEKYRAPKSNQHVDGQPVGGFLSAGDSRAALTARIQYFTAAAAVTKLHEDVSNIAGIDDELAREINKQTYELTTDMEGAFLEDDDHLDDNGVVGYRTRGVGSWVSSSAQTLDPVNASFRPAAAQCITTATGSITENAIIDVLQAMGTVSKQKTTVTAFVGPSAKRVFNQMPLFTPASVLVGGSPTGATGITYNKNGVAEVGRVVERYLTDFATVELNISWRNLVIGGTATEQAYCSYFLHRDMWELRWHSKPMWQRKEYQGGAYEAFCEAVAMLVCKNPAAEGKWAPTS